MTIKTIKIFLVHRKIGIYSFHVIGTKIIIIDGKFTCKKWKNSQLLKVQKYIGNSANKFDNIFEYLYRLPLFKDTFCLILLSLLIFQVIEPVLKTHRAYRFAMENPQCDKFVLCDINSHDPNEKLGLAGFKSGTTKVGSMAAAWVISAHTGTPFWTLFAIINDPYNCEVCIYQLLWGTIDNYRCLEKT